MFFKWNFNIFPSSNGRQNWTGPNMASLPLATAEVCDSNAGLILNGDLRALQPIFRIYGRRHIFAGPVVTLKIFEDNVLTAGSWWSMVAGACAAPFWAGRQPRSASAEQWVGWHCDWWLHQGRRWDQRLWCWHPCSKLTSHEVEQEGCRWEACPCDLCRNQNLWWRVAVCWFWWYPSLKFRINRVDLLHPYPVCSGRFKGRHITCHVGAIYCLNFL